MVKRPPNTRFDPPYVNFSSHSNRKVISVWGAICKNGPGKLIRLDSRLNGQTYAEILDTIGVNFIKDQFGSQQCYWIEDNCPAHKSNLVGAWFDSCSYLHGINCTRIKLASYSPDLNIIENSWGFAKHDLLYDNEEVPTCDMMWAKVKNFWEKIIENREFVTNLFNSMENRLDNVLRNDGFPLRF